MTIDEKAAAIAQARAEANAAHELMALELNKFNTDREHTTDADFALADKAQQVINETPAKIAAIQSATLAPNPPSLQQPPKTPAKVPQAIPTSVPQVKQNVPPLPNSLRTQLTPQITGTSYRAAVVALQQKTTGPAVPKSNNTINVAVSTLKPNTPVSVHVNGHVIKTTAGEVTKVNPQTQVAVSFRSAFSLGTPQGNVHDDGKNNGVIGHDGRGSENAHSHAFGGHGYGANNTRSEGFGGASHFH
jgi:hypothetical protein